MNYLYCRTRLQRDRERDISEKIALGMPSTAGSGGVQYDQRLFNQSKVTNLSSHTVLCDVNVMLFNIKYIYK